MIGLAPRGKVALRSGAEAGDAIFVTGELGGSLAGRHLEFEPRVTEGRWLTEHFPIHAMIDISDGLAGDLRHILKASRVGAELLTTAIPVTRTAKLASRAESSAKPPLLAALTDGEDFELLFTIAAKSAVPLLDAWKAQFPNLKLSCIGKITAGEGRFAACGTNRRATIFCLQGYGAISHSPTGTVVSLGEAWGRTATNGLVIALSGDLGAGKTQLVKGLARGIRFRFGRVHSPTFTLVNVYTGGRLTLFHLDLYRLETKEQIFSAGIEEYLRPDGVAVIEWAERSVQ